VQILGVRVDLLTVAEAVELIVARAADPRSAAAYVVKPYVEFFTRALRDPETRSLLDGAWLSLADGVAAQWAAHHLAISRPGLGALIRSLAAIPRGGVADVIPERVAGITFTRALLARAGQAGLSVQLIGAPKRQAITDAAERLASEFSGLRVSGAHSSPRSAEAESAVTAAVEEARPDLVLVAMGFPRQERLMASLAARLPHGVFVGEGGSFDFEEFGGHLRRAPVRFRRWGLEWLWRLLLEPSRLRRQLAILSFVRAVHRQARSGSG
jgi:N-acetylglucosaminyldiphosphoundecaprenol N-acetyl-beta-D-mannosaminyltransferase